MPFFNKLFVFRMYMSAARILIKTFALSPFHKDFSRFAPERIIIFRTCALGDFILSVPTFSAIRQRFPDARICLVTMSSSHAHQRERVHTYAGRDSLPWLSFVVPTIIDQVIYIGALDLLTILKTHRKSVREFKPDLTIHVSEGSSSTLSVIKKIIFLRILGVKGQILGLNRPRSLRLFRNLQFNTGLFKPRVLELLESTDDIPNMPIYLGKQVKFSLNISNAENQFASDFWRVHELDGHTVIAVAPGAIQPHKRWPINAYVDLCLKLIDELDAHIVVVGNKNDFTLGEMLARIPGNRVINLLGLTSIGESAALFSRIAFLVSNDGGAVHLASAVGRPVVSIISGIEYPGSIDPWHSPHLSVRLETHCSPCYSFTHCPQLHNKCITGISVDSVMDRCRSAIALGSTVRT